MPQVDAATLSLQSKSVMCASLTELPSISVDCQTTGATPERHTHWSVSVRALAELVWRRGDLKTLGGGSTLQMGAEGHRFVQASRPDGYNAEVYLSSRMENNGITLDVSGRADGVFTDAYPPVLEEIKTTTLSPLLVTEEMNPVHWAQAKLYGAMYCDTRNIPALDVQLTYLTLSDRQTRTFRRRFQRDELREFLTETAGIYTAWLRRVSEWRKERDRCLQGLTLPYPSWRPGQQAIAEGVRRVIREQGGLFAEAPTGSGKTLAVLFGALQAMAAGEVSQMLFLTAKTVGRISAETELCRLTAAGYPIKVLSLTARPSICPHPGRLCTAGDCPLAAGHFDRLPQARQTLFEMETADREAVEAAAAAHVICPYWLSRDLAPWMDGVICDYNYVFDPGASLASLKAPGVNRILLMDEAHNLLERAREMFSASLAESSFRHLERRLGGGDLKPLARVCKRVRVLLREIAEEQTLSSPDDPRLDALPHAFRDALHELLDRAADLLANHPHHPAAEELRERYFESLSFLRKHASAGSADVLYVEKGSKGAVLSLLNLDPSERIRAVRKESAGAAVYFSGTLSPLPFFRSVLGNPREDRAVSIPPVFPEESCLVTIADRISTLYKHRSASAPATAALILSAVQAKRGNYLAYFPSYEYLNLIAEALAPLVPPELQIIRQHPGQTEQEKQRFLEAFASPRSCTLLALAVLGGVFGEGIDLSGPRLIGAIIVSPGLPKVTVERQLIRAHFDAQSGLGFDYAYLFPGMNKVIQAAGRVIRSETDRGMVLFIGRRFSAPAYRELLESRWRSLHTVDSPATLLRKLHGFWASAFPTTCND